jgi:NAD(P)-dependent dehydrogenase (short-subunit alcohol dehydrogenase family)
VVEEIKAAGGEAVVNTDDVADWAGARHLIEQAVDTFGGLDVLVNNAGILRDRTIINMSEEEWDDVVRVNLRGHFAPTKWPATYWRDESKADRQRDASIINSVSGAGLFGMPGQANYCSTKAVVASLTLIAQAELDRYGVRCNAVSPSARTRVTDGKDGASGPTDGSFDFRHPGKVAPFVAYLGTAACPLKGKVFFVRAGEVHLLTEAAAVATTVRAWHSRSCRSSCRASTRRPRWPRPAAECWPRRSPTSWWSSTTARPTPASIASAASTMSAW